MHSRVDITVKRLCMCETCGDKEACFQAVKYKKPRTSYTTPTWSHTLFCFV